MQNVNCKESLILKTLCLKQTENNRCVRFHAITLNTDNSVWSRPQYQNWIAAVLLSMCFFLVFFSIYWKFNQINIFLHFFLQFSRFRWGKKDLCRTLMLQKITFQYYAISKISCFMAIDTRSNNVYQIPGFSSRRLKRMDYIMALLRMECLSQFPWKSRNSRKKWTPLTGEHRHWPLRFLKTKLW